MLLIGLAGVWHVTKQTGVIGRQGQIPETETPGIISTRRLPRWSGGVSPAKRDAGWRSTKAASLTPSLSKALVHFASGAASCLWAASVSRLLFRALSYPAPKPLSYPAPKPFPCSTLIAPLSWEMVGESGIPTVSGDGSRFHRAGIWRALL